MSRPDVEYEETLAKAQRIFDAFRAERQGLLAIIDNYDSS